jgi:peroxiredoxin
LKGLKRRYEQFREAGAAIVTISTDLPEALEEYRSKSGAPFMMLSDPERKVIKDYDIYNPKEHDGTALPAIFIIDRSGVVRYSHVQSTLIRVRNRQLLKIIKELAIK